jgi:hypothetical protein
MKEHTVAGTDLLRRIGQPLLAQMATPSPGSRIGLVKLLIPNGTLLALKITGEHVVEWPARHASTR